MFGAKSAGVKRGRFKSKVKAKAIANSTKNEPKVRQDRPFGAQLMKNLNEVSK